MVTINELFNDKLFIKNVGNFGNETSGVFERVNEGDSPPPSTSFFL